MNLRFCQWLTPLLFLVSGCTTNDRPATETEKNGSATQTVESGGPIKAPPIKVAVATVADLEKLIAQQNGKVVVLDLWALW